MKEEAVTVEERSWDRALRIESGRGRRAGRVGRDGSSAARMGELDGPGSSFAPMIPFS